ncbi:uncharacterized protein LOC119837392 [Zerene cesonia]|uniref:uncharacterized protein LOC119837392 n=1 Tax=Zerene cesonia TaxID=33412 RepID=UPI0018E5A1D8|nr:uncharacterized protein LOC119837392 [Zerene cesonia]
MDMRAETTETLIEQGDILLTEKEFEDFGSLTHIGRRIVEVKYFFEQLQEISSHPSLFQCNLSHISIVGEKRIGLISHFRLKCELCGQHFKVTSDYNKKQTNQIDINTAACSGIVATGVGYSQFEEMCSAMDVPIFTEKYFAKIQDQVFEEWEATAVEAMEVAAKRERDAAFAEGRVKDGLPVIDVYIDGAWSARSYGTNYKALSGVAAIVGRKFGEVLFIGVKNKYCLICARAEKKKETAKEHVCHKKGSSTGMEAAIIVEGFKKSLEMYGLIYGNVIGDGDSSTYAKIVAANPYPNHIVSKIECRNHLLRNMCKKLRTITKNTRYPIGHRKLVTEERIMTIRKVITSSIKENKQQIHNRDESIKNIHADICNPINHGFGDHRSCKDYYCNKDKSFEDSVIPQIENSVFWFRVRVIINSVASNSRSLYEDVDTNTVERLNSVIAKFVGGKRINFSFRRS